MEEKLVFPEMKIKKIKKEKSYNLKQFGLNHQSSIVKNINQKPINTYEQEINNIKYKIIELNGEKKQTAVNNTVNPVMIEIIVNDRYGQKERIKCYPNDSIAIVKKIVSAKTGTRPEKIRLQKASKILKDTLTLEDYEIKQGMSLEMYYN